MTGHGGYLMQYDRLTEDERLQMYIELEPDLVLFDQTKNELEIQKLTEENQKIERLQKEVEELRKNLSEQDMKIINTLKGQGVILS
jgi:hypothetical protein